MWHRTTIVGRAVDCYTPAVCRTVVLFLHDRAGTVPTANAAFSAALEREQFACLAPHGEECWWVDRLVPTFDPTLTPQAFVLEQVLPFGNELWRVPTIAAVGIGMGGQAALRLGFRFPERFPIVVSWNGALDYHDEFDTNPSRQQIYPRKVACRQDTPILQTRPERVPSAIFFAADPTSEFYRSNDRLHEKLNAVGVPHEFRESPSCMIEQVAHAFANGHARSRRSLL